MLIWCDYLLVQNYFVLFWYLQPFTFGLRFAKVFGCSPITKHTFPHIHLSVSVRVILCNATFNNISVLSWRSVLFVEETWVPRENHRPTAIHWQTSSHIVVSSTPRLIGIDLTPLVVIGTNCIGSCKSSYHMIITTMASTSINSWWN